MREWLTVIIVLLILGVLLHGWRHMRQSKHGSIKMSRKMPTGADKTDIETYGSELPNGGARVTKKRDEKDARDFTQNLPDSAEAHHPGAAKPKIKEQVDLGFDQGVPMLMESVVEDVLLGGSQSVSTQQSASVAEKKSVNQAYRPVEQARIEPVFTADNSIELEPSARINPFASEPLTEKRVVEKIAEPAPERAPSEVPQEVLVINVMAPKGQAFGGEALQNVLFSAGMRYGDMDIFHHYAGESGEGEVLFSMANMVKPGTFDLARMHEFTTPGVSFFLSLPTAGSSLAAFNTMADTAKQLVDFLGGELKDEQRSVMTNQTLEHCRQRIGEFERKRLM